ncbi:MAG: HAMP domain-containing histidine kinase, partial [Lachnospiraceae bacterium]|nr:HAMP domain-containing histidine kinase [Lachnospiraceae bacterium]
LLTTIDDLQKENIRVSEAEAAKIDFLRAASHELKTPVTALCGMLDNMIMGIGRYKDWETYLPICQDMAVQFGKMIQEILDASKLNFAFGNEPLEEIMLHAFIERLLSPYLLIAKSKGVSIDTDFSDDFSAKLPLSAMEKVLSNIISNAVKYTKPQCNVKIYFANKSIVVENECLPIPLNDLSHIFEPFYRPDFSRSRNSMGENPDGGNGLGLYITAKILNALGYRFEFKPFLYSDNGKSGMRFTVFF